MDSGGPRLAGIFFAWHGQRRIRLAAEIGSGVAAVVSRGGRPDLAGSALAQVDAPTLLIVGGEDGAVIDMNRDALGALRCEKELAIVPGGGPSVRAAGDAGAGGGAGL